MKFWKELFNLTERVPVEVNKVWRRGMWVVKSDLTPAILWNTSESECTIHTVDTITGETVKEETVNRQELRQAKWHEIPECRRGISQEQGKALGYGS